MRTWEFLTPPPPRHLLNQTPLSPALPRDSFIAKGPNQSATDFDFDPRRLLRRRSSLVVADIPVREHPAAPGASTVEEASSEDEETEFKEGGKDGAEEKKDRDVVEKKKPPPTQFKEPDASSLLDAFGF